MAGIITPQNWNNYGDRIAREELRAVAADLDFVFTQCEFHGRHDYQIEDQPTNNTQLVTWATGNTELPENAEASRLTFFNGLQHMLDHNAGPFLDALWVEQEGTRRRPWVRDQYISDALVGGTTEWGAPLRWVFIHAGLSNENEQGWGWRFSLGTEVELGITAAKDKPVLYYPFNYSESPEHHLYRFEQDARAEAGHLAGPWLTQDISMMLNFLYRCKHEGIRTVLDGLSTMTVVETTGYHWVYPIHETYGSKPVIETLYTNTAVSTEIPETRQVTAYRQTEKTAPTLAETTGWWLTEAGQTWELDQTAVVTYVEVSAGVEGITNKVWETDYELVSIGTGLEEWQEAGGHFTDVINYIPVYSDQPIPTLVDTTVMIDKFATEYGLMNTTIYTLKMEDTAASVYDSIGQTHRPTNKQEVAGYDTTYVETWFWTTDEPEWEENPGDVFDTELTTWLDPDTNDRTLSVVTEDLEEDI